MSIESKELLQAELVLIEKWEKEQKDIFFWEKLGRLPFAMLDKLTPKIIRDKLGMLLNELGAFLQNGGRFLVNKRAVLKHIHKFLSGEEPSDQIGIKKKGLQVKKMFTQVSSAALAAAGKFRAEEEKNAAVTSPEDAPELAIEDIAKLPIAVMDQAADDIIQGRIKFAAASGAATGVGGIVTMAADLPLMLGTSLKTLQEIAICYGYDPEETMERVFIVKCLQFSSADIVGKKAIIEELSHFDEEHTNAEVISQLQGWREVVTAYRENYGWKQLFQMIPIAGIIFGSISNKGALTDVSEAGKMLYKKRRLLKKLDEVQDI
ncbi:EcsC family protein [Paenibacillus sp. GYB006]|uniref:EcsC family protein n=1 Tax=Paenibacillus sp. GYB006 TaxID=2994394 RepID=UPI002F96701A